MFEFEKIEVCHKFMTEIVPFIPPFRERGFVLVYYSVSSEKFVIKRNYDR